jgi:predicted RNA methylase
MKALNLANATTTNKRRELDFYPTPKEVTHALMRFMRLPKSVIWEPACGTGDMSEVIASYGHEVISTDLRETGYGEGGVDFLQSEYHRQFDAIITNPPFNVSEEFIWRALDRADIVCMLLKSQYWHAAKRYKLFTEHRPAYILPLTWRPDFMGGERGGAPTMEVAWTIWRKGFSESRYIPQAKPIC